MYGVTLKYELYRLYSTLHGLKDNTADIEILTARISEVWEWIDQAHVQKLVASIPVRLDECQDTRGWYTTY